METRRFIIFLVLSMIILIGWTKFGLPIFFPQKPQPVVQKAEGEKPPVDQADADKADDGKKQAAEMSATDGKPKSDETSQADAKAAEQKTDEAGAPKEPVAVEKPIDAPAAPAAPDKLPTWNQEREIQLGTLENGAESSYFLQATISRRGAALQTLELNDDRYHELQPPKDPLKLLGSVAGEPATFETAATAIDEQLKTHGTNLKEVEWEIVERVPDKVDPKLTQAVVLRYPSPDGKFEIRKRYEVHRIDYAGEEPINVRDTNAQGYQVDLTLTVVNKSDQPQTFEYVLQGPAGVPLEDPDNTRKYRDAKMGYYSQPDPNVPIEERTVTAKTLSAKEIAKKEGANEPPEIWEQPFKYLGIDVQYFTALVMPVADPLKTEEIAKASPQLIGKPLVEHTERSDISIAMTSAPVELKPGGEFSHSYTLYAGPKRTKLLAAIGAESSVEYGSFFGLFNVDFVSKPLIALLKFIHDMGIPYGIAIIILTVMVRACMFPVSLHQAKSAQKMKELQPLIAELKKKYANDKEKFAKAQMELFSKHNYNIFGGCLPLLLQLPIFMGLYAALGNSVDLRAAKFLWIDNLAAPDALFHLPFKVPIVGWTEFNLLPIITVAVFMLHQKLFMPPAAPDDEQAQMQQKMMKFMMIFMGFMFYRVPAGLCVYLIASSLWGMGERKLLDLRKKKIDAAPPTDAAETEPGKKKPQDAKSAPSAKPEKKGLFARIVESAEAAAQQAQMNGKTRPDRDPKSKKKKSRR